MGDYSSCCAISGLPITSSQKIVAIELEPYRFASETGQLKFVPANWPVFGEYDNCGGVEGTNISHRNHALIHLEVWENADQYFHKENSDKHKNCWFDHKQVTERAEKEIASRHLYGERDWKDEDYFYHAIEHFHNYDYNSDYWLVFRTLLDGGKDVTGHDDKYCFLHRGQFGQIIAEKIAKKTWSDEDFQVINKLACLYSGQMMFGRAIRPSGEVWLEQYPEYSQRIKLLKFHLNLARKLDKSQKSDVD